MIILHPNIGFLNADLGCKMAYFGSKTYIWLTYAKLVDKMSLEFQNGNGVAKSRTLEMATTHKFLLFQKLEGLGLP